MSKLCASTVSMSNCEDEVALHSNVCCGFVKKNENGGCCQYVVCNCYSHYCMNAVVVQKYRPELPPLFHHKCVLILSYFGYPVIIGLCNDFQHLIAESVECKLRTSHTIIHTSSFKVISFCWFWANLVCCNCLNHAVLLPLFTDLF